jgi:VRR-NUC domain
MTEKELQDAVIDCLHRFGWYVAHFSPAPMQTKGGVVWRTPFKADGKGFPDIVAVRDRLITIELKSKTGRVEPAQVEWAMRLNSAGVECYTWYPGDWLNGTVENTVR